MAAKVLNHARSCLYNRLDIRETRYLSFTDAEVEKIRHRFGGYDDFLVDKTNTDIAWQRHDVPCCGDGDQVDESWSMIKFQDHIRVFHFISIQPTDGYGTGMNGPDAGEYGDVDDFLKKTDG